MAQLVKNTDLVIPGAVELSWASGEGLNCLLVDLEYFASFP